MLNKRGDMWAEPADAWCVTTNLVVKSDGSNVMGGGVARQAATRWPALPMLYGGILKQFDKDYEELTLYPREHVAGMTMSNGQTIVFFPTKRHFRDPSPLELVVKSAVQLIEMTDECGWETVVVPQPGCGLGGLSWTADVEPILSRLWDDRFVVYGY